MLAHANVPDLTNAVRRMTIVLLIGVSVGTLIGVVHASYVYRHALRDAPRALGEHPVMARIRAGYYALWTLLLWGAFGSYVLSLWMVSIIAYAAYKGVKMARPIRQPTNMMVG